MSRDLSGVKERAEARFKKAEIRAVEGSAAKADYDAAVAARDANAIRLKALREERDRMELEAAVKPSKKRRSDSTAPSEPSGSE